MVLSFELPGVSEKDVSVSMTDDLLTVKGERRWAQDLKEESTHRLERRDVGHSCRKKGDSTWRR